MTKLPEKTPENQADKSPVEPKQESRLQSLGKSALHLLVNNWPFKLISVLLALVLWSGLITQDPTLTREKNFTDVNISVTGEESMKRNGYIVVSDLSQVTQGARVSVDVPQMQYANASANNYSVRIDLSRIRETGVQQVKVQSTSSSTWGTVTEIYPETVEIEVEEFITRYRIPVSIVTTGSAPEGYYAASPSLDPPLVAVSGPRSVVEKVARAEATLELNTLPAREGLVRTSVPFRLMDSNGDPIESDLIEVTSESVLVDSVVVEQYLYAEREIDMNTLGLIAGTPATGYAIKSVTVTPATITAAGWSENLDVLDTLYTDSAVDVTGASSSFTAQIRVRQPSELTYLSSTTVTVAVEIGPVIRGKTFEDVKVTTENVGTGYEAVLAQKTAGVTISGPQLWVEKLRKANLTLTCDASGLTEGTYDLPILCKVEDSEDVDYDVEVLPGTVQVVIRKK